MKQMYRMKNLFMALVITLAVIVNPSFVGYASTNEDSNVKEIVMNYLNARADVLRYETTEKLEKISNKKSPSLKILMK